MCRDALPVRLPCPAMCSEGVENICIALISCPAASECWRKAGFRIGSVFNNSQLASFLHVAVEYLEKGQPYGLGSYNGGCWPCCLSCPAITPCLLGLVLLSRCVEGKLWPY